MSRQWLSSLLFKDQPHTFKGEFITGKGNGPPLVLVRVEESLSTEVSNVACGDKLQRLSSQCHLEACGENLAEEIRSQVFEEGGWAQDHPVHVAIFAAVDQMVFNIMFLDEMGYLGGILERVLLAAAVNGTVDEELDLLSDRLVDQRFSLRFFCLVANCRLERRCHKSDLCRPKTGPLTYLHTIYSPDGRGR